jgi:hypothetical protein
MQELRVGGYGEYGQLRVSRRLLLFDFSIDKNFSFLGWSLADGTLGDVAFNVRALDRCHHHRHRFCTQ